MKVSIKETIRHIGTSIIVMCAILISTLFINFYLDIKPLEDSLSSPAEFAYYNMQETTAKLLCGICCSFLLLTSAVVLGFYIRQYMRSHIKELGIQKALGYSNFRIAKGFSVFGINIFVGAAAGYVIALLLMDYFYDVQNVKEMLPSMEKVFHPWLMILSVGAPATVFAGIAVLYAMVLLRKPVIKMIREDEGTSKKRKAKVYSKDLPFLKILKRTTIKDNAMLSFFIMFAALSFASVAQASFAVDDYASDMMGVMIMIIGLTLSVVMLLISVSTLIESHKKPIAVMRAYGYSYWDCYSSILGCYRVLAYLGYAIGTVYQYFVMKLILDAVFKDFEDYTGYEMDVKTVLIMFAVFVVFYEAMMIYFSRKLKDISLKKIMIE
ncbi:MAG: FtsX-like permease family protein [Lachnospiraceae bacterium]|nr:FtsX-like permease family protein [Lachnospiraceae bacterium]MCR4678438.1 FtsX-like permease family protein [Lachnospiraceae bacterium]